MRTFRVATHHLDVTELEGSHAELRAAIILAGREIRNLNFGSRSSPVMARLRAVGRRCPEVAKRERAFGYESSKSRFFIVSKSSFLEDEAIAGHMGHFAQGLCTLTLGAPARSELLTNQAYCNRAKLSLCDGYPVAPEEAPCFCLSAWKRKVGIERDAEPFRRERGSPGRHGFLA